MCFCFLKQRDRGTELVGLISESTCDLPGGSETDPNNNRLRHFELDTASFNSSIDQNSQAGFDLKGRAWCAAGCVVSPVFKSKSPTASFFKRNPTRALLTQSQAGTGFPKKRLHAEL
jgi:hypothetical protein